MLCHFLWHECERPSAWPNVATVWTQSPRPVILSILTAMILSLELQSLKARACTVCSGHVSNDGHTHAQLILLPLSLCSTRSTGLPVQPQCTGIKLLMNLSEAVAGTLMREVAFVLIEAITQATWLLGEGCLCSQDVKSVPPVLSVCQVWYFRAAHATGAT